AAARPRDRRAPPPGRGADDRPPRAPHRAPASPKESAHVSQPGASRSLPGAAVQGTRRLDMRPLRRSVARYTRARDQRARRSVTRALGLGLLLTSGSAFAETTTEDIPLSGLDV